MTRTIGLVITCVSLAAAARAEDVKLDMKWDDLCDAAKARELTIVTNLGKKVRGTCYTQDRDSIQLNSPHADTFWRTDIKSVRLDKRTRLHSVSHAVNAAGELGLGGSIVFVTPYFLLGPPLLVGALGTLAGAPFCLSLAGSVRQARENYNQIDG